MPIKLAKPLRSRVREAYMQLPLTSFHGVMLGPSNEALYAAVGATSEVTRREVRALCLRWGSDWLKERDVLHGTKFGRETIDPYLAGILARSAPKPSTKVRIKLNRGK